MRLSRIHTTAALSSGTVVELGEETAHYVAKVLRLGNGDVISLFNATDGEFSASITAVSRKSVSVQLGDGIACHADPVLPIHLGLGLSRGERMDFAIQKATELGVGFITPLFSERCEVKLGEDRAEKRLQHWSRVAISASEQSGRCQIPEIRNPMRIGKWLEEQREGLSFVLDHHGSNGFPTRSETTDASQTAIAKPEAVNLLVGPEGGLSRDEVDLAINKGFQSVRIGKRILRTETAPLVAISLVQMLWGDFS